VYQKCVCDESNMSVSNMSVFESIYKALKNVHSYLIHSYLIYMYMHMYVRMCVCVCTHTHIAGCDGREVGTCAFVCVCPCGHVRMCVCVCVRVHLNW